MKTMCPPSYHHNGFVTVSLCVSCAQLYPTIYHVPKCMSCHKAIVVMTGRVHYFHD